MSIPLEEVHLPTPDLTVAFRPIGELIMAALREDPARAYKPQEITSTVLQHTGASEKLQATLAISGIMVQVASLFNPDVHRLNTRWQWILDSILNVLLRDGKLQVTVHEGAMYLHVRDPAQLRSPALLEG
jgi:hypothetical protein